MTDIKKDLSYYRCGTCGFVYLDDEAIIDAQSEKKHYELHNNSFECRGYVEMFEKFIDVAVTPYVKNAQTALEFGCGSGPVLAELLRQGGMEVDQYDLYFYPEKVYEEKVYDLITSTEVFEHLKEPLKILTMLTQHLVNGGYLILMTKFPPSDDQEFLNWWYRRDVTHIGFFTAKSFEVMANEIGLLKVVTTIDENIVIFQKQQ
ncbi:class I SAM-dependent methyltransferase [bacterium]|nr:class I SAM-dependent methyltransferase [bacterium]MBU1957540.1 class I SAM-dependent methyltransferase [bacterium]